MLLGELVEAALEPVFEDVGHGDQPGRPLVPRAWVAAPVPRPPQPTRAMGMVCSSPA